MSSYFYSERELVEIQNDVRDELRRQENASVPMITRHGWIPSKLHGNAAHVLDLIADVLDRIRALGFTGMLAYGTLLGAVRGGKFIAHDDDVDLFVVLELDSMDGVRDALQSLCGSLARSDIEAIVDRDYDLVRIKDGEGAVLDIFPLVCLPNGSAVCHHSAMVLRDLPREVVLPVSMAGLHGRSFEAPASADAFLEWRYGADWRVEKQFFEMEWVYA
jgi:hypothetical protein